MANLTRYKQKIFANNSNQVGVFGTGTDKVASKNVETLQSADYEDGWSAAIVTNKNYPVWQERDGVDYGFSYQLAYLLQKGIPEWLSTETYYTNDYCKMGNVIYYSLQDNNVGHNPSNTSGYWTEFSGGSARNIGEIVSSTIPLTDAGLHLLDGTLLSGDGSYAQFVGYIADLYDSGDYTAIFETEANWQAAVTLSGVCGKFVYDSVNNTVRLPKITGFIEGGDTSNIGNLVEAGLPNITGSIINTGSSTAIHPLYIPSGATGTGALYLGAQDKSGPGYGNTNYTADVHFDASNSNPIYGNASTVQPQAIKVLYYIVIATTTKTSIEVDIDEIATDLNGKADVDLSNVPSSKGILTESYVNGTSWYRVYSDGWCEQGGAYTSQINNAWVTINLLKTYSDTNYNIIVSANATSTTGDEAVCTKETSKTTGSFMAGSSGIWGSGFYWRTCGYVA